MDNDGSYHWNNRILRITRSAYYELDVARLRIPELVEGLDNAINCPRSRRRRNLSDWCTQINGVSYKIVIADEVFRAFDEPCWSITHIKPYNWSN